MFRKRCLVIFVSIITSTLFAQELVETGFLRDHLGQPITEVLQMKYKIFTQPVGGVPVWDSGYMTVSVNDGMYMVRLGAAPQPTLDSHVIANSGNYYMGIEVDGDIFPTRELIAYHARAILADTALHVDWANISGNPTDMTLTGTLSANMIVGDGRGIRNVANFKRGSGSFTAGEAMVTITDNFCTSDTLIYLNILGSVTPLGVWNVNTSDGIITILSDRTEKGIVPFEYVMIKEN